MIAANLNGPFYAIHSFLPKLKAARGTVVIISSVSGAYTDRSGPAYQAAKSGGDQAQPRRRLRGRRRRPLHGDPAGRRRHRRSSTTAPSRPTREIARPDAARRGRRGGVRVRRRPPAARLRGRADDPAYGAAGDREDDVAITSASGRGPAGVEALDHVDAELAQQRRRSPRPRRTRRSCACPGRARRGSGSRGSPGPPR